MTEHTLVFTINGATQSEIYETSVKISHAFFGEEKPTTISMAARALQTPDGQVRSFIAEVTVTAKQ